MMNKGANDWECGLYNGCRKGHVDVVELMVSKGVVEWKNRQIILERGFGYACKSNCTNVIRWLINYGVGYCSYCDKSDPNI